MKATIILGICLMVFSTSALSAQTRNSETSLIEENWIFPEGTEYTFERFNDRNTLLLDGRAELKNADFTNGTIEVDVYANTSRSFAGLSFRKKDDTLEELYLRMHKSDQPDALQYTPIFHGESNWQLYRELQANLSLKDEGWNHLKIEVMGDSAEVLINGKKVLTVNDLRTDHAKGRIGLFALFENRFSNFKITPKEETFRDKTQTTIADPLLVRHWQLSEARPYDADRFERKRLPDLDYRKVASEPSGLLPISKFVNKPSSGNFEGNSEDFVVARIDILSQTEQTRRFSFDYSDKIILYLNGKEIYRGNNAFRSKGIQHTGHLQIDTNTVSLNLQKGTNVLECVVIEKSNGWGIMGKFESTDGIEGTWKVTPTTAELTEQ